MNEVTIEEESTSYEVTLPYHSNLMAQNYDSKIKAIEWSDNRISIYPDLGHQKWVERDFTFEHSDPDRVIAIANMMLAVAQMVKNNNAKKPIDISDNG